MKPERSVEFEYCGKKHCMVLTAGLEFDLCEEYGKDTIFDVMDIKGRDRLAMVCNIVKKMCAECGDEIEIDIERITPMDAHNLDLLVYQAVVKANAREVEQEGEVDEGLAELEKKKVSE